MRTHDGRGGSVTRVLALGVALTAAVTVAMWLGFGRAAIVPGFVFGGLATGIQVVAVAVVRPAMRAEFATFIKRWAVGIGLRIGGVVLFAVAVVVDRALFPPIPSAIGYLGVLVPLLFTETRFLR